MSTKGRPPGTKSINLRVPLELHMRLEAFLGNNQGRTYSPRWTKTSVILDALDVFLTSKGLHEADYVAALEAEEGSKGR